MRQSQSAVGETEAEVREQEEKPWFERCQGKGLTDQGEDRGKGRILDDWM